MIRSTTAATDALPDAATRIEPDPAQRLVLEHDAGALLVTGAPGTGKTAVLLERFVRLVEAGQDPERIGLIVRTRRARQAARRAVLGMLPKSLPGLRVVTVHGLAHHVLGAKHRLLGHDLPPEVLTASDQFARVRELLRAEPATDWPAYGALLPLRGFADEVRQFLLRAQEALLTPADVGERATGLHLSGWFDLARFYGRYLRVLDDDGVVDYAGLVQQAARAAGLGDPPFDHLLVDDYQEATLAMERLIVDLRPRSLVVAGDPGSHVFSFQGTTDAPIERFVATTGQAGHVELGTAHRSAGRAVRVQGWQAPHTSEEHAAIGRELRRIHVEEGVPWRDLAVVVRRQGGHLGGLLRALDDAGVPRTLPERGLSLAMEAATSPFIMAFRWLAHRKGREGLVEPILTSDLVGLSPATARGLIRAARSAGGSAVDAFSRSDGLSSEEAVALDALQRALARAQEVADRSATDAFRIVWTALPFSQALVAAGGASRRGRRDLDAVVALSRAIAHVGDRGGGSVAAFLDVLDAGDEGPGFGDPEGDGGEDAVRVFTAHGVAGQEFDTVIVSGVVEGDFPSLSRPEPMFDLAALEAPISQSDRNRRRLEEERRLFGVVVGRARRRVLLTASDPHHDDGQASAVSRFAAERAVRWTSAPAGPPDEPLTVAEAVAAWRRRLADTAAPAPGRLAALDGLAALGEDPSRWWFRLDWTHAEPPPEPVPLRVSYSRLSQLENCELQYLLGQEIGLEGDAGYHAWVGHLVHRLIEESEDGHVPRTQEALVAEAERRWQPERFPSFAVSEAFRRLVTTAILPAWVREYGAVPAALAREVGFEFEFAGATVTGKIDRIGPARDGVQITDYKTGKARNAEEPGTNLQLGIYYLALLRTPELAALGPVRAVQLAFLRDLRGGQITHVSKAFLTDEPEYRQAMEDRLTGLIERLAALREGEVYRPDPAANCRFCDFRSLCPLWPEGRELFPVTVPATEGPEGAP